MARAEIVVEVCGGIVQAVYCEAPSHVTVVDWDVDTLDDPMPVLPAGVSYSHPRHSAEVDIVLSGGWRDQL